MQSSNSKIIVIGSANMDLVLSVDRLPRAGETIAGGDLALYPGGKGANQACAAGRLGGRVSMIALVGQDAFGDRLIESLQQAGVDTAGVGRSERATGCASIYVMPNGENSIVISPGANAALDPAALPFRAANVMKTLQAARRSARAHACSVDTPVDVFLAASSKERLPANSVIASGDYLLAQLETPLETVQAAFQAARASRAFTILDPAPARALPEALLGLVDFLTPNQTEAATILGAPDMQIRSFQDAAEAARQLLKLGPASVVLKLGPLGCFVHTPSFVGPVEAFQVCAVDTTAAGDVFNGAFAVALAEGKRVAEAARFANAAAAISVTRPGAQSSVPSREEVGAFLAASGRD